MSVWMPLEARCNWRVGRQKWYTLCNKREGSLWFSAAVLLCVFDDTSFPSRRALAAKHYQHRDDHIAATVGMLKAEFAYHWLCCGWNRWMWNCLLSNCRCSLLRLCVRLLSCLYANRLAELPGHLLNIGRLGFLLWRGNHLCMLRGHFR